jgi:hypothetical protein
MAGAVSEILYVLAGVAPWTCAQSAPTVAIGAKRAGFRILLFGEPGIAMTAPFKLLSIL